MKIAIDARGVNWYKGTGIGTYTEKLVKYLSKIDEKNQYNIYWSGNNYEHIERTNWNIIMASKKHHRFFEQQYFPNNLNKEKVDIYHVPQNGIGLCEDITCKKVVTIHDLIPYIMPETVGHGYLLKFLTDVPKVIQSADAIITVSKWSKNDILKFFPIDPSRVFVTPLAADDKYKPLDREFCRYEAKKYYNITKPFVLYIGGFSPRKNVKSLIIAFSNIYKKLNKEHQLVIVGATRDEKGYLMELSSNLELYSDIIFTGYAPEEHLPMLYNACDVFVYPSLYEGFGLPPLEAMSCGTPVITSNTSSIPEVVGDCALLIDPFDSVSLMNYMEKLLNEETYRTELGLKGFNKSKDYSWENTARTTLDVYEQINLINL